jgi:hypothetical protein
VTKIGLIKGVDKRDTKLHQRKQLILVNTAALPTVHHERRRAQEDEAKAVCEAKRHKLMITDIENKTMDDLNHGASFNEILMSNLYEEVENEVKKAYKTHGFPQSTNNCSSIPIYRW